ncbi:MAG TPA: anhydro-N-acetylmuramic acid kinase [Acholeplasmataceae bacterium]|nr:anhydro-N-acetylmuramic acid kinase [Acholeplasmataceae bacterium]
MIGEHMKKLALGIMSGTSLDGIDCLIAEIEGTSTHTKIKPIAFKTYPFEEKLLNSIKRAFTNDQSSSALLCSLNFELGEAFASAAKRLVEEEHLKMDDIDFIASHGQTIYHIAEPSDGFIKSSLQLGEGAVIANLCNTTVVSNFRTADIAAGGQGAPLVPFADYILFTSPLRSRAIHNIGGIANQTVLPKAGRLDDVFAFDSGPGNMMIDYAMKTLYGKPFDQNGDIAKSGSIISSMMNELFNNPYFKKIPPKSTGRELFGDSYTDMIIKKYEQHEKKDIISTLTHFTARTIIDSYKDFVFPKIQLDEIIFSGGGSYNSFLIETIASGLPGISIRKLEDLGYDSASKEALAFIILGNETLNHQPSNVKSATGAKKHVILGQINDVFKGND